jgi:hypothetical protein
MQKEFGKLTEDQFRRFVRQLPEFRKEYAGFEQSMRAATPEKLRELLGDGIWWAPVYEVPFGIGLACLFYMLGETDRLKELAALPDPQEFLLREMEEGRELDWDGGPNKQFSISDLLALSVGLQRNVLSIMIYKRTMSALVAEVREGNDNSLFDAVRLDRSAVSCPTIASRITRAELLGEKRFFQRLRNALKGPTRKHWESYQDLRYSLALLREMGFDKLSDAELEHLMVDVLGVYPKSFAARKNLRKQYYESKKFKTL